MPELVALERNPTVDVDCLIHEEHGPTPKPQEKYKRKKAKKYVTNLTLKRPTARTICEVGLSACME